MVVLKNQVIFLHLKRVDHFHQKNPGLFQNYHGIPDLRVVPDDQIENLVVLLRSLQKIDHLVLVLIELLPSLLASQLSDQLILFTYQIRKSISREFIVAAIHLIYSLIINAEVVII